MDTRRAIEEYCDAIPGRTKMNQKDIDEINRRVERQIGIIIQREVKEQSMYKIFDE